MNPLLRVAAACLALTPGRVFAGDPAAEMTAAANAWLDSLTAAQRQQAVFVFQHTERENWHYVPRARKGVSLGDMNDAQRTAARQLLVASLSERGRLQIEAIIALENVLRVVEGSSHRDPQLYFFTVFGVPHHTAPWGWLIEGHHLSINFTLADGSIAATALFWGQPRRGAN